MKEYIEKSMAFAVLVDFPGELSPENIGLAIARKVIDGLPAADVAPVRHGRWEQHPQSSKNEPVYTCSLCKLNVSDFEKRWLKYCPNCGALMDGKESSYE